MEKTLQQKSWDRRDDFSGGEGLWLAKSPLLGRGQSPSTEPSHGNCYECGAFSGLDLGRAKGNHPHLTVCPASCRLESMFLLS